MDGNKWIATCIKTYAVRWIGTPLKISKQDLAKTAKNYL